MELRSRKSRKDQMVAHLSAVATARREEVGWGDACQARVVEGVVSAARGVSVGTGEVDVEVIFVRLAEFEREPRTSPVFASRVV